MPNQIIPISISQSRVFRLSTVSLFLVNLLVWIVAAAAAWVDDTATSELMKLFYRRMPRDGMRPAATLREAQVEMWKRAQGRSPFYCAGFVLQGERK